MSSLVPTAVLGIHRIPASLQLKSNLLLQQKSFPETSGTEGHRSAEGDTGHLTCHLKEHSGEEQPACPLSCPYQANAPLRLRSAKP